MEEPERRKGERKKRVFGDSTLKHLEHLRKQARALSGEVKFEQEDLCLETTHVRLSSILRRHEQLKENLRREPEKIVHERLEQEFEAARMAQTQGAMEEPERRKGERKKRVFGDSTLKHLEHLRKQARALSGEVKFEQEDLCLETTRVRLSSILRRHEQLKENLREPEESVHERLEQEFEAARMAQTQEICLDGDEWNDGVLATIRERVHIEADARATKGYIDSKHEQIIRKKITYKIGNKVVCGLDGARIGIQYDTSFAGEPCEIYYCVLESRSFLQKMHVSEHTIPFFLPLSEAENEYLSSNVMKFIDDVGEMLQAYIDRREQVRLVKKLYCNQIGELYHSLPLDMIEFVMEEFNCKVTVSLSYDDMRSELPTRSKVLAWPLHYSKAMEGSIVRQGSRSWPSNLAYAEDALRKISLPQAYAEIRLNLQGTLRHIFPCSGGLPALPVRSSGGD